MSNFNFGEVVIVRGKLVRTAEGTKKFWKLQEFDQGKFALFLGLRTLWNGTIWFEEYGVHFDRTKGDHFQAALVALGPRENPIYVSMSHIEKTMMGGIFGESINHYIEWWNPTQESGEAVLEESEEVIKLKVKRDKFGRFCRPSIKEVRK